MTSLWAGSFDRVHACQCDAESESALLGLCKGQPSLESKLSHVEMV